jgi:HK97 family phage major capsid protein
MKGQVEIPQTSEELEELLNDGGRMNDILKNGEFGELTAGYIAKAMEDQRQELASQMKEQLELGKQQVLQSWAEQGMTPQNGFRPGGAAVSKRDARAQRIIAKAKRRMPDAEFQADNQGLFSGMAMGAEFDEEPFADSMRAFMYRIWKAEHAAKDSGNGDLVASIRADKERLFKALSGRPQNASLSERLPAEGGFLVPEVLRSQILMLALEQSVVRPRAQVIPMDSLRVPLPIIDDTSHASSVYGGVAAYWTAEGATLAATAPTFGRFELEARKLTAYTTIPNELLQDSITPLDRWFDIFFPKAMAYFEDVAFISGTGVGEPQGFLNAPAAISLEVSGDVNTIAFADIAAMFTRMWPPSLRNAVWLCSPDAFALILQLSLSSNVAPPLMLNSFQAVGAPAGGSGDGVNYTLMGRPLVVSEKIPSSLSGNTATAGALSFVDLSQYLLGDRQSMQIATSEEYLFASDLVAYRVIERLDGRIWQQTALTPQNGSAQTLSPVVLLNTTASSA